MGTLLAVLAYLAVYETAVIMGARLRNLRRRAVPWTVGMILLPVLVFPLGFLAPPLGRER